MKNKKYILNVVIYSFNKKLDDPNMKSVFASYSWFGKVNYEAQFQFF